MLGLLTARKSQTADTRRPADAGLVAEVDELIALGGRVKQLGLDVTSGTRSAMAGSKVSRFRGRGMDFDESREYMPGDDARHIDWRVTARTGKAHTKLYTEERERPVFVVVDYNPGMYFGTRGALKSVTASRIAACVAWSVIHRGDRIGGVLATPDSSVEQRPAAGRRGVLGLVRELHRCTLDFERRARHETSANLSSLLEHTCRVVHPGSLVILISDFYQQDDSVRQLLSRLRLHNDLVACQVVDALEHAPPASGQYLITDGAARQVLDTRGRGATGRYQRMVEQRDAGIDVLLRGLGAPLIRVRSDEPVVEALAHAFGRRWSPAPYSDARLMR